MTADPEVDGIKQRVRQFYDRVGWQTVADGTYQNARYEDLRPVSSEYIRRCHFRVKRFLPLAGRFLLDAGSGPVQYAEYLTYSEGYQRRVCIDISIVALQEARRRVGEHGLFVVADIANLPFVSEPFDGVVSLHTLHHLPLEDQLKAYQELYRVLKPGKSGVVVNGWTDSPLMRRFNWLVRGMERSGLLFGRLSRGGTQKEPKEMPGGASSPKPGPVAKDPADRTDPVGTFIRKQDAAWLREQLTGKMKFEIRCWRSVSVRFLRAVIHEVTGGRIWLRLIYWLEDRFPHFMGEKGQYPLIVIRK
ncbi:MAG: class I SAM-dependent methyltransferase [Anaerolineaceae bacterium]|nr:class I SAM-dependent methyltransferase [Anaerolineaceae bacterium]